MNCFSRNSAEEGVAEFLAYFKTQLFEKNNGLFETNSDDAPTTNNGLDATNGWIKGTPTLRGRLPLGQFFIQ